MLAAATCQPSNGSDDLLDFIVLLKLKRQQISGTKVGHRCWQSQNRGALLAGKTCTLSPAGNCSDEELSKLQREK
jgi:hypothetical protein